MSKSKKVVKVSKSDLVREVAKATGNTIGNVNDVFAAIEEAVVNNLSKADEKLDVSIKLFEGITINAVYTASMQKVNNLTKKIIDVPAKIHVKPKATKNFEAKINFD